MPTPGVVEPLNLVKDIGPGFIPRLVFGAKHSFDLQRGQKALYRRTVPALSAATHATGNFLIGQQALEVFAGVLATLNRRDALTMQACPLPTAPSSKHQ